MIVGEKKKPSLDEQTLAHFGVKGMRWGVRRQSSPSGNSGPSRKQARQLKNNVRNAQIDKARAAVAKRQQEEALALQIKSGKERVAHILAGVGAVSAVVLLSTIKARSDLRGL